MMQDKFQKDSKMPPGCSGSRFQRSQTFNNKAGGYDTYGNYNKDNEEEEDYRNYKEAQRRDDPWSRSGGKQRDHSIGSDFDKDGNAKSPAQE